VGSYGEDAVGRNGEEGKVGHVGGGWCVIERVMKREVRKTRDGGIDLFLFVLPTSVLYPFMLRRLTTCTCILAVHRSGYVVVKGAAYDDE
jgi:hypothetical protein